MVTTIDEVVRKVEEIKRINDSLQSREKVGSANWHSHETMDDRLHEVLAILGQ